MPILWSPFTIITKIKIFLTIKIFMNTVESPFNAHLWDQCLVRCRERSPLIGDAIFCHTVFWDENICPVLEGVRCIEMTENGGATVPFTIITCIKIIICHQNLKQIAQGKQKVLEMVVSEMANR